MKGMVRLLNILLLLFILDEEVQGQLNFQFIPEVYGRSIDGLGMFSVQNLGTSSMQGNVIITVRENNSRTDVVSIITPNAVFNPGNNNFPGGVYAKSSFKFSNNPLASIVSQTRSFPPGEYTFCFRFADSNKGSVDDFENCIDASIQPLVPITLLSPGNGDHLCQKRPPLSWQPPIPFVSGMKFRLQLTEKNGGASVENLMMNTPLILLDNISSSTINYPANSPDLKEGKTYCWQVVAYQSGLIISKSEIWEFTVQCTDPKRPSENDSYRELKQLVNGNYYIARGYLKFSFQNNYNIKRLNYTILDISNGLQKIKHLPEVQLQTGLNKIDIDLSEMDLIRGKQYILRVYPFNESEVEIRFTYQEINEE